MRSCLGLSIGATNLVAVPAGRPPTVRSAVLTLFGHRPAEVGVPSENPRLDERGLVLTGFVERVGDPVPIVASDGSAHSGERLVVDALEALTRSAGLGRPPERTVVAVPAHWRDSVVDALRAQLPGTPVVSDAVAALTALRAEPGLPARGIVALCDFGATGTSITLADAAAGFRRVGQTVRYDEFSGDQIDQAIVKYVLADLDVDPSSTSAVVALTRFREQCRMAKERLSAQTATGLAGPMPGPPSTVRLTRAELEALIRDPLDALIGALQDMLRRNNIHPADLAARGDGGRRCAHSSCHSTAFGSHAHSGNDIAASTGRRGGRGGTDRGAGSGSGGGDPACGDTSRGGAHSRGTCRAGTPGVVSGGRDRRSGVCDRGGATRNTFRRARFR